MNAQANRQPKPEWIPRFSAAYAYTAAVMLALMGVVMLYTSMDGHRRMAQLLGAPDALFGVSTRTALLVAGILHVVLCAGFLLIRDPIARGMLGTWAAWNFIIYRLGMAWLKAVAPFPAVQAVARKIGVQPNTVDGGWKLFIGYLLLGGAALLVAERQRLRHLKAVAFLQHWREVREAPHTPARPAAPASQPAEPEAPAPTSTKHVLPANSSPANLKFSCPCCGQHIRCDEAYRGRQINCPACRQDIQVPQLEAQAASLS